MAQVAANGFPIVLGALLVWSDVIFSPAAAQPKAEMLQTPLADFQEFAPDNGTVLTRGDTIPLTAIIKLHSAKTEAVNFVATVVVNGREDHSPFRTMLTPGGIVEQVNMSWFVKANTDPLKVQFKLRCLGLSSHRELQTVAITSMYPVVKKKPAEGGCTNRTIKAYQKEFDVTKQSPEMGGGHSQPEWCDALKGSLRKEYLGADFSVIKSGEHTNNQCPPFNCPRYVYTCTIHVRADPICD
jgi:hypothetical protein